MVELKGITWDHDRGYSPLIRTSESFSRKHPDIRINWRRRSLKDFGDYPIEKLAQDYDLLLIDHPFSGEACEKGLLVDLNGLLPEKILRERAGEEMGRTVRCYNYGGKQLALPVDAAALVSAERADLMEALGQKTPETYEEVLKLAAAMPEGKSVAVPLCPTDIWCLYLSFGAAALGDSFITGDGFDPQGAEESLHRICVLAKAADPRSLQRNPVQTLDCMSKTDEIVYVPYCFGYVNYAWTNQVHPVRFGNSPLWAGAKTAPIMGGVGIAISAASRHKEQAAEYVSYVTEPEVQAGEYMLSGGQPGQLTAWQNSLNNMLTGGFFLNTLDTIEHAFVRPRIPGWNPFQEKGADLIHSEITAGEPVSKIAGDLNALFRKTFPDLKK